MSKTACEARAIKGAVDKATAMRGFEMATERVSQIEELLHAISGTDDPKAIQELQARIAVEQAALANEDTKLRMVQMISDAESKLIQQQQHELQKKRYANTKMPQVAPLTFK